VATNSATLIAEQSRAWETESSSYRRIATRP
jgi:hypothetical protein